MKLLILSANLGGFDPIKEHEEQELPEGIESITYHRYTDADFPPRFNSMTPRLQARIPKMMGWQMKPDYDYYIWIDSSCRFTKPDAAIWLMKQLGDADIAVFKHPDRDTVQEEADYLKERLELEKSGNKKKYILPRYENERVDDQLAVVDPEAELYASTVFIYKNNQTTRDLLTIWWLHTSLYHSIDQLSLPKAIDHSNARFKVIPDVYHKSKYLESTR